MASDQVEMYQLSNSEQTNDKENVILRALAANPVRHNPLTDHPPPTTTADQEATPASMYTLETRYQPIPSKVLPKRVEPKVYYIESKKEEKPLGASAMMINEEPEAPVLAEQEPPQTVLLEPKIISQPVLYSIVGAKSLPAQNNQPIPIATTKVSLPLLYTITGQPHHSTADTSTTALNAVQPAIEKPIILYTLVASPQLQVRIQEPVKTVSEIPQQSSPSLYRVVGNPHVPPSIQEPVKAVSEIPQQSSASLYRIVGNPHLAPLIQEPVKAVSEISQQSSPNLYRVVGNPHVPPSIQQSVQNASQIPKQLSPILYSIVANPTLTTQITYPNTPHPPPATQPIKASSIQPVPILFTVVGETQVPNNISKENRPPLEPVKKQANNVMMHTVVGNPSMPQSIPVPQKAQPLQPQNQQHQQVSAPSLYLLVGKPNAAAVEKIETRAKPPARKKTPPPVIVSTRRISRSLDRQTAPEPIREPLTSISPIKKKHQPRRREPTIPKAETIFIPRPDNERTPRPKKPEVTPWHTNSEQANRQPHQVPNYDPLRLPDYISPYAYHPVRSYREQTVHPTSLPIIKNNRDPRNPRPPIYEPHLRKDPRDPWAYHSLERYPARHKGEPRLWDYENETHSDNDDANDEYRKQDHYRRLRLRTPWIPVW